MHGDAGRACCGVPHRAAGFVSLPCKWRVAQGVSDA